MFLNVKVCPLFIFIVKNIRGEVITSGDAVDMRRQIVLLHLIYDMSSYMFNDEIRAIGAL